MTALARLPSSRAGQTCEEITGKNVDKDVLKKPQ